MAPLCTGNFFQGAVCAQEGPRSCGELQQQCNPISGTLRVTQKAPLIDCPSACCCCLLSLSGAFVHVRGNDRFVT
jgi:hypothetical protein